MSNWSGKTRGSLLGYKIFVSILNAFGTKAAYLLLIFVAFYFVLFSPKSTKSIYLFLRNKMNKNVISSLFGIYRTYFIFGQTLIDKVAILSGATTNFTYEFDGRNHLEELIANQQGGLLVSGHLGNWDVAANFLKDLDNINDVYVVVLDAEHQKIKAFLSLQQSDKQFHIIPLKDDGSHIFKIHQVLKANKLVCIHGDRFIQGQKIKMVEFLGEEAAFPIGPFKLAKSLNKPISFVYATKESLNHYHFFASPMKFANSNYESMLDEFVADLAKKTKTYPHQWFNFYDFWQKPIQHAIK